MASGKRLSVTRHRPNAMTSCLRLTRVQGSKDPRCCFALWTGWWWWWWCAPSSGGKRTVLFGREKLPAMCVIEERGIDNLVIRRPASSSMPILSGPCALPDSCSNPPLTAESALPRRNESLGVKDRLGICRTPARLLSQLQMPFVRAQSAGLFSVAFGGRC